MTICAVREQEKIVMKGKVKIMKFICGLAQQENEYVINGVKYIVGSSFRTAKTQSNPSITDRFKRIITSDFVDLTSVQSSDKIKAEYVCSAAGKEDLCSRKRNKNN